MHRAAILLCLSVELSACSVQTTHVTDALPATSCLTPPTPLAHAQPFTLYLDSNGVSVADPNAVSVLACSCAASVKSTSGSDALSVTFNNQTGNPLSYNWIDYDGSQHLYGTLGDDGVYEQGTYETHPWLFKEYDGSCLYVVVIR